MVVVFGFNNGNRLSVVEVKHIVGKLRLAASHDISSDVDSTICDLGLHRNVTFPTLEDDRSNII